MSTIKSGWLEKYSGTIFKSWKRRFIVLYNDGELAIYDNPNQATADSRIHLASDCRKVDVGFACGSINLPKGQSSVDALFRIETKSGKEYFFAASSDRECREWVAQIEQGRRSGYMTHIVPQAPPQAPMVYQQNVQGGLPPPYTPASLPQQGYRAPYPQQHIVYQQAPVYGQPAYGAQPMYGPQPGYAQPVYVQGPQQNSSNNSSRNMFLGAAAGGLGGFMLGNMVSNSMHHGSWGHDSFDHGGWGHDGFDHGGFDGGGCDGGFDF